MISRKFVLDVTITKEYLPATAEDAADELLDWLCAQDPPMPWLFSFDGVDPE